MLYAVPGGVSLVMTVAAKQPLFFAWNTGLVLLFASLADDVSFAELRGATLVSGLVVASLGLSGLTSRVADLVPGSVVFAVVAASVLPFVVGAFDALDLEPALVGVVVLAWGVCRCALGSRVPPIVPGGADGIAAAAVAGRIEALPGGWTAAVAAPSRPEQSLGAVVTVVPVFVALISFHSNLTAVTYLRSQDNTPPVRAIEVSSGLGAVVGSIFTPATVGLGNLVPPCQRGPRPASAMFASGRSTRPRPRSW